MKPIQQPIEPVFDPSTAVAEMKAKRIDGKVIGYHSGRHVNQPALLICISSGGPRDSKSVKPSKQLWGFIYLHEPGHEPRFVASSAVEAVNRALGGGAKVCLFDSLAELLGTKAGHWVEGSPAETLAELRGEPETAFPPVPADWLIDFGIRLVADRFQVVTGKGENRSIYTWCKQCKKWHFHRTVSLANARTIRGAGGGVVEPEEVPRT